MADTRPIIVVRKKVSHGGHHGGAWKVAYADFVTAMMALFIVLWLLNSSKQVREAVGGYFKDPTGKSKKVGNGQVGSGDNFMLSKDNMDRLKDELQKSIRKMTNVESLKNQVEMTVTGEGLRIELLESEVGNFFQSGKSVPSDNGKEILIKLANELGKLPNKIFIEGHTDSKPFAKDGSYSNWELSADRANSVRKLMQENGLGSNQVTQVRGYADQMLRKPDEPLDPSNRRITLMVQNQFAEPAEDKEEKAEGGEKSGEHGEAKADHPEKPSTPAQEPKPAAKSEKPAVHVDQPTAEKKGPAVKEVKGETKPSGGEKPGASAKGDREKPSPATKANHG